MVKASYSLGTQSSVNLLTPGAMTEKFHCDCRNVQDAHKTLGHRGNADDAMLSWCLEKCDLDGSEGIGK